ncbi:MAG: hypothetical protein KatS3mg043_1823 [Rhodothermaceae bacterium]|nr:MAG: hypothetical protein KatS3mg043_1823 [Rhodothermaceae bacterium]
MNTLTLAQPGTVYLVGAGPGDPSLITVRGLSLLRQAGVVVYDRLVHPALPAEAPAGAERIYVGKAPGRPSCPQATINALLIAQARAGKVVVRLKGGDPFVFGRGGEEALALAEAGVPFEVVPGVTSAVSVPAYAGIPVTHRGLSSAFTVVTGHTCDAAEPDWAALARAGTLVILMGLRRLPEIARHLQDGGLPPATPVAVIHSGTTAGQAVVTGTLADIGERTRHLASPATIVVGEVARLHAALAWFTPPADPPETAVPARPARPALAVPA